MNKSLITVLAGCLLAAAASAQSIIAYWDQNSNGLSVAGTFGYTPSDFPQAADQGSGTLTLGNFDTTTANNTFEDVYTTIQSFGGSTVNALPGVVSGGSFSPQVGPDIGGGVFANNGMNLDINVSTLGFSGISVSWSQRGTSTGFASRAFSYSTDGGGSFSLFATDTGALSSTFTVEAYDLTAISALDNNASVVFRVVFDGGTTATGNNRLDNILVTAAVPEPSTYALLLGAMGLGLVILRRRRS